MKVENKNIIVTGAGSGMGRELTIQLVRKGAKVAMVDINTEAMQETANMAGPDSVTIHPLNISDREKAEQFATSVIHQYGSIDAFINNAGIIQPFVDIKDLSYADIERVMNINFYGTVHMIKAFIDHLLSRPEAHIANVSSMGGFIPFPGQTLYSASKAAVKILSEGLYAELKDSNVGVTVFHPGAVNTNIVSNSGLSSKTNQAQSSNESQGNVLSAKKAAAIMINGIEKNRFRVMVGKDARLLDFLYRLSPQYAIHMIVKKMGR